MIASHQKGSWLLEARKTFLLGLPIMTGLVGQMLMGVADTVMVGRVGTVPLAAVSIGFHLSHLLMVTGFGVISGITVFTAKAFGVGNRQQAGDVLRCGLRLSLGCGLIAALILGLARKHLALIGQPPEVVREGDAYLLLIACSMVPMMAAQSIKQFGEALARPWTPMMIYTGGVLLNILLNWVLIYGHWGSPAMGISGAGWATLISRSLIMIGMFILLRADAGFASWVPDRHDGGKTDTNMRQLVAFGAPVALLHFFEVGAFAFAGVMTGWLGAQAMAANQIAITCAATTFTFALGFATAVGIRVGHAWGRSDWIQLRRVGLNGMGCTAAVMGVFGVVFLLFRHSITGWFSPDADVVLLSASLLLVAAFFQLFDGQQVVAIFALRGMEDVRTPAMVGVLAHWCVAVPVGYMLSFRMGLGAVGIWIGLALGLATVAITLGWRFHRLTSKRQISIKSRLRKLNAVNQSESAETATI